MKYDDYEDKIEDVDEVAGTDVKINSDYYIHECLRGLQKALSKEDIESGMLQFQMIAEHLEILARSAGHIGDDYDEEFKKKSANLNEMKLAHLKVSLVTRAVFGSKVMTDKIVA